MNFDKSWSDRAPICLGSSLSLSDLSLCQRRIGCPPRAYLTTFTFPAPNFCDTAEMKEMPESRPATLDWPDSINRGDTFCVKLEPNVANIARSVSGPFTNARGSDDGATIPREDEADFPGSLSF